MSDEKITLKLASGTEITGTIEQVTKTLKEFGIKFDIGEYYYSKSKGLVKISEMNTTHLRNAILRFYEDWVQELHTLRDPKDVVARMMSGISDPTWLKMVREYSTRKPE